MTKKGASNFTQQVTKELIREQKRKQKENEKLQKEQITYIFISTSNFSAQCEKFASDNNIFLINKYINL